MSKFESKIKQVPYSQKSVFDMLSDLNNIERVRDRIPEDKIKDLEFDSDSVSISSPMGPVTLRVVEREEPKCIKFETENRVEAESDNQCRPAFLYGRNGKETAGGRRGENSRGSGHDTLRNNRTISH